MDFLKNISFTPEWIQAIAGVFGVIGLLITILIQVYTVRMQARTSSLQAKQIFRDEELQRLKLMPSFSISEGLQKGIPVLILTLIENGVNMVFFEAGKALPIKLNLGLDAGGIEKPGKKFVYSFNWIADPAEFKTYKAIRIEYWDVLGNIYNQTVHLLGKQFSITPPQINYRYELESLRSKKLFNRIKSIFKKKKPFTSLFQPDDNI